MIERYIRDVPDFPKPGILFKDVTPLLQDAQGLRRTIDGLARAVDPATYDVVAGIESRGFLFGAPLALRLGLGFTPIRKPGKLPAQTTKVEYLLEYGTARLAEVQVTRPQIDVLNNVDVAVYDEPERIRDALVRQAF